MPCWSRSAKDGWSECSIFMSALPSTSRPEVVVPAIVIDAGSCSRGIGKTLMSAAERWASERGYHSVALYSNVSRDGAHSFYNVLGYRLLATSHLFRRDFRN